MPGFGRGHILDLTNRRFGRLVVLARADENHNGHVAWVCRCDCGATKIVEGRHLTTRTDPTVSCGCFGRFPPTERSQKYGANFCSVYKDYVQGATRRGLPWQLSEDQALALFTGECFYCGAQPANARASKSGAAFLHNGIDRLDPALGYIEGNVVPCCSRCNHIKGALTKDELLAFVEEVHAHLIEKGSVVSE